MSASENYHRLTKRVFVSHMAALMFLACWPPTPARGQCYQGKLIASDAAANDNFGRSVAVDGDTAVVGVPLDDHAGGTDAGSAYVFVRIAGHWAQQAKLTASDTAASDNFGISVGVSGNTVVVGSYFDDHTGGTNAGSAYVFTRSGTKWTEQAKLIASDAAANDNFGRSVAISGDTAIVGSYNDDHAGGVDAGSAYVFVRSGTVWSEQGKLITGAVANDKFGVSVAVSGDTALIGAYLSDAAGNDSGNAYLFVRTGGVWNLLGGAIPAGQLEANDFCGYSVALSGNTAVVGAYGDNANTGTAYVSVRSGTSWFSEGRLFDPVPNPNDRLGISVGIWGDRAIVGQYLDDSGPVDAGAALVFFDPVPGVNGNTWSFQAKLLAPDANNSDFFGHSVAGSVDTMVIGADLDTHAGGVLAGSAYIFAADCDADADGVPDLNDVCSNTPPGLPVCANGRPQRDCNNDCLVDGLDVECFVAELLAQ